MTDFELLNIRLYNQLLMSRILKEPKEIVSWMGAMQAQVYDGAKWGIGVRLADSTVNQVEAALNAGQIFRTHILRPTWHLVTAEDIHWMRELTAKRLLPVYIAYARSWGADEELIAKASWKLVKILEKQSSQTKQEISEWLAQEGFDIDQHHLSHVLSRAELEGVVCSGITNSSKHTYALLEMRAPKTEAFNKEEALGQLAYRYFASHGPATLPDFVWWSGLLASEARIGLESVKEHFVSETLNGRTFWMQNDLQIPKSENESALLLPPFDEFVVSYKDRPEMIKEEHYRKVMTKNGIFSPTIMLNGKIVGSWKKINKKKGVEIKLSFFEKTSKKTERLFEWEMERIKKFYGS